MLGMITGAEVTEGLSVILALVIIEGLLSVDNALAIAAMAAHLPPRERVLALRLGIIGAYVFRGLALALAFVIIGNIYIKMAGALFLVYVMASHLCEEEDHAGGGEVPVAEPHSAGAEAELESAASHPHPGESLAALEAAAEKGELEQVASTSQAPASRRGGLWTTVMRIEAMDLALSVDNVVAAVAMSDKFWAVVLGVFIGILALRFLAGYCFSLIDKYPILKPMAFIIVGFVGAMLLFELLAEHFGSHIDLHAEHKFAGILVLLVLAFGYERSSTVRAVLRPILWAGMPLMRVIDRTVHWFIILPLYYLIGWPLLMLGRGVWSMVRPRAAGS